MAGIFEQAGDLEEAIAEYKNAVRFDQYNSVIHLRLAENLIKKNDFSAAIEELNAVVKLDPEAVEPHAILALVYFSGNKVDEAAREYETALKNASKLDPKNISIYKNLGAVYLQKKNLPAAESTYKLVVELVPGDAEAHFYLGNIYDELKNKDQAVRELKKTIELKPDYADALNYLGYLYVEADENLESAEARIKKAFVIEPDNGAYIDSLGWLYYKKGKFADAVKTLTRASAVLEDPVILDHLGDAYLKVNDREKACAQWEKALKLDPQQEKIKGKIDKLK